MAVEPEPDQLRMEQIRARFAELGLTLEVVPTEDGDWQARWRPQGEPYANARTLVAGNQLDAAEDALAVAEGGEPPLAETEDPEPAA
jgi:hypothetical protein